MTTATLKFIESHESLSGMFAATIKQDVGISNGHFKVQRFYDGESDCFIVSHFPTLREARVAALRFTS